MIKSRLTNIIDEFFAIGANHDLSADRVCRAKILEFLREEDNLLLPWDDENLVLGKDVIHYIDASNVFAQTTEREKAYYILKPFLDRMLETESDQWHFYHLNLLSASFCFTATLKDAQILEKKALHRISQFKRLRDTKAVEAVMACQLTLRILDAQTFDQDDKIDFERYFKQQLRRLKGIADADQAYEFYFKIGQIRWEIFNGHPKPARKLCDELETNTDKMMVQLLRKEIETYSIEADNAS